MKVQLVGVCGTFMAGLAVLAKELGFDVYGCDKNFFPPMSRQLEEKGIPTHLGYQIHGTDLDDDIIIGNALSRGVPLIEALLDERRKLYSGPEWLYNNVLSKKRVLCVTGTHGKTTVSSMLAWILECAGYQPGFLIGGIPNNFGVSARLGSSEFFVIEGDEYDSAFFDKRSKFCHYRPETVIINNIEFDHADIFKDLSSITQQFHHMIRTIPQSGSIVYNDTDPVIEDLLERGSYSQKVGFGVSSPSWSYSMHDDQQNCDVFYNGQLVGHLVWELLGEHNSQNAVASIAAASSVGISPEVSINALSSFKGSKRRLELKGIVKNIKIYDDFAHHPTAIEKTISALKAVNPTSRILAVVDLRSNTMKLGSHEHTLAQSTKDADTVFIHYEGTLEWDVEKAFEVSSQKLYVHQGVATLFARIIEEVVPGDIVVVMSNGHLSNHVPRLVESLDKEITLHSVLSLDE